MIWELQIDQSRLRCCVWNVCHVAWTSPAFGRSDCSDFFWMQAQHKNTKYSHEIDCCCNCQQFYISSFSCDSTASIYYSSTPTLASYFSNISPRCCRQNHQSRCDDDCCCGCCANVWWHMNSWPRGVYSKWTPIVNSIDCSWCRSVSAAKSTLGPLSKSDNSTMLFRRDVALKWWRINSIPNRGASKRSSTLLHI